MGQISRTRYERAVTHLKDLERDITEHLSTATMKFNIRLMLENRLNEIPFDIIAIQKALKSLEVACSLCNVRHLVEEATIALICKKCDEEMSKKVTS